MRPRHPQVTILTSGVGLGTHIPALLIERRLRRRQCEAETEVLEEYFTPEHLRAHLAHKKAHHESFALAQIAHRMARPVSDCIDAVRARRLLERWAGEGRRHFIVWSGFWLPLIEDYRQMAGGAPLDVDHCRIDAEMSASFRIHRDLQAAGNEVWLWNWDERKLVFRIPVADEAPIPFAGRDDRLVVHGGGWGIGTYRGMASDLARTRYALDVVIDDPAEAAGRRPRDRCFMLDPEWHPWSRNAGGGHDFPPMGEVLDADDIRYRQTPDHHVLHDVIRRSKAIVSKPGGCTLIDSLDSGTPVVLLEPYGHAEESNARIWEHLGFGISYAAWRETNCDESVLERLHANIVGRARTGTDYPRAYAERLQRRQAREAV
ncbi:MAG: hypothetical protein IPP91_12745 [Betaproteobacteria bacterium]|nr:hypothetical protein [Betaproteobacteria bacterium]